MSGPAEQPRYVAFPAWATIPSYHDLGTGRVIHFFFAWMLVGTLLVWLVASIINGHLGATWCRRIGDVRRLAARHRRPREAEVPPHARLQHAAEARLCGVLFVLLPLMILTGLAMSPGGNALLPFLPELLGGRQTARTIHFIVMLLLVGFFVIHIADDPRRRSDQRAALDHHRLVPHRSAGLTDDRQRTEA